MLKICRCLISKTEELVTPKYPSQTGFRSGPRQMRKGKSKITGYFGKVKVESRIVMAFT